jgi:hypothetical protein
MGWMSDSDILRAARRRYEEGVAGDRENRTRDEQQRKFYRGRVEDQWDSRDLQKRKNRITTAINRAPQFVKQITGEMRQNKPAIRVLPVDDQTDPKLAEVYSAIIRHIESNSDAHRIYSKAGEQGVIGGIGWFRILTDYLDDKSFDQEIVVRGVRNPLSVVVDPGAWVELTCCNMGWAIVSEMIPEETFKAKHPKASLSGFDAETLQEWKGEKSIRVAEYWVREEYERELLLLSDGSTRYGDELSDEALLLLGQAGLAVVNRRKAKSYKVKCYKITGVEILETYDWAGSYIPLIPVIGEEIEVGDEIFRHGLVFPMMEPQRAYNFARSAMMETVASQPKAPFLVTTKMVANPDIKKQWDNLNEGNPQVLPYDPDPAASGGPQRLAPPNFAAAWYQEALTADGDMKATTGIYDASLGKQSNETSGRAIMARDQQGETASYVYVDNLSAAIRHAGKIMLELIPKIYTGERVIRIMGEDGAIEGYARINTRLPDGAVFNDISVGQFDLEVTTGPAFATKRMEAADKLMQLVQSFPQIAQVGGDMIVKALDIPYGDKLADRLALALVPPGMDPDVDKKRAELAAAQGPKQPDPMQEIALAGAVEEVKNKAADTAKKEAETRKIDIQAEQEATLTPIERGVRLAAMGDGPKTARPAQPGR